MKASVTASSATRDAELAELIDRLTTRLKAGEPVDPEELRREYPDCADELLRLLPAAQLLAELPLAADDGTPLGELGDYRLVREVGRGGMGIVYEAEQISLGRRVALKVLPYAATLDAKQLQRFKNEARAAAGLKHEHIVSVYAVGCERGVHFYSMEFIDGQTLAQLIAGMRGTVGEDRVASPDRTAAYVPVSAVAGLCEAGPGSQTPATEAPRPAPPSADTAPVAVLSTERSGPKNREFYRTAAGLLADAADALEHAHGLGIVHRDVKPGNLLVDAAGKVYVSDFGLARFGPDAGLTVSGDLLGTLRYMAPEQALARHGLVDHRADVYALGATLYELLTGRPAVDAEERAEILRQIAFEEPTPPRKLDKAIPAELETIALKCLAKNPIERYATANELADDLTRFHDDQPIRARRAGPVERVVRWGRRHPAMVAVYGLLVLVLTLATSGGAAAWQWRVAVAALQGKQKAQAGEAEAQRQRDEVRDLNDRLQRTLYAAQMNLTQAAWEANNFLRVKELLNQVRPAAGEPDLRGWEWDYWQRRLPPARLAMTLAQPLRVAVAQDGSFVAEATSTQDGTMIKLYDTATGQVRRTIGPVGDTSRLHLALSGDGKRLATAPLVSEAEDTAPTIRVWDTATGRELFTIPLPRWQAVVHSTFSPDGRRLVTEWFESIRSSKTRIWDLEADKELFVLSAEDLKFSRDGARIAGVTAAGDAVKVWTSSVTGGGDAVKVWDATTGRVLLTLDGPIDRVCDLAFSPDDRQVAAATTKINDGRTTGKVIIWDAVTGRRLHTLPIPAKLSRLEYTPDSRRLVAAAWVGPDPVTVAVWDAASGEAVYTLTPGPGEGTRFSGADVRPLALSPVGSRLACADATGAVTVWDLATGRRRRTLAGHAGRVVRLRFTPDGSRLVTVGQDSQLRVWDATGDDDELITLPMTLPLPQLLNFRSRLALAPNGDRVAGQRPLADGAYELKVWNVADGREVFTASVPASGPGQYVGMMAFSPDGRRLATTAGPESVAGGLPSEVKVWDLTAGRELSTIQRLAANGGRPMTFSPDGVYLALATGPVQNKAGVRVVEAATGRQVWDVDGLNAVTAPLTYSPDGRRLVVCTLDREVELKDILPRRPTPRFSGIVKVLDAATGRELLTISKVESTGISNSVVAFSPSVVAFSPDGRRLATATPDVRRIDVWDADTGQRLLTLDGIDFVADIAYSPDGRRLAVVGREESGPPPPPGARIDRSQIKMWDAEAGRELLTVSTRLSGPMNSPRLTFRPDGHKLIVVGTHSGSRAAVEVFDATPLPPRQVPGPAPLP